MATLTWCVQWLGEACGAVAWPGLWHGGQRVMWLLLVMWSWHGVAACAAVVSCDVVVALHVDVRQSVVRLNAWSW